MITKKDPKDPFWYLARKCTEEVKTWPAWKKQGLESLFEEAVAGWEKGRERRRLMCEQAMKENKYIPLEDMVRESAKEEDAKFFKGCDHSCLQCEAAKALKSLELEVLKANAEDPHPY